MFFFPPPPFGLFLFLQSLWWTPRETVWHWWLGEGIISMCKISSPCQTCQLFHTPSHNTHTLTQSMLGSLCNVHVLRYVFFSILQLSFWVSNGCNGSWRKDREHLYSHMWHFRGRVGGWGSSSLCVRWVTVWLAGAQSRHREMAALSPAASHFVFCWRHLQTRCRLKRFVEVKSFVPSVFFSYIRVGLRLADFFS